MVLKFLRQIRTAKPDLTGLKIVAITGATIAALLLLARQAGWLQSAELRAYDQMMQLRPDPGPDPRLLIVAITEEDVLRYKPPLSDKLVAQMLAELQRHQPTAIGLDLYRDFPREPGHAELVKQLQNPNLITIRNLGTEDNPGGIPAPLGMPVEQVGFNDVVSDPDGVVRRNLVFAQETNSFSFQLAFNYLAARNTLPDWLDPTQTQLQWGKAVLIRLEKKSGGYQNNDDNGWQILLDYRTGKKVARRVTLTQVLQGQVKPDWISGKVVLIGATAESLKDLVFTPYSAAERINPKMPGVEIHAQMVSQYLDMAEGSRSPFRFWTEGAEVLWILGWVLIGGGLAWQLRNPLVLVFSSTAMLGVLAASSFLLFSDRVWVPVAMPTLGFFLTGGVVVAYRAQQAQRQQQMVMTLLGQNASPEIAAALWTSRDRLVKSGKLPGQKLIATMLFTDIKDFSTISEQMPPEELLLWLNEYLSAMTQEIQTHQGIVNKFTGDGLMAVFGVPMPRTTEAEIAKDAQGAVAAGLAMGDRLQELNRDWQQRNLPVVKMRAGIFTGPVVAGSLGGKERMEYGIIGDSVNIASRLESCDKHRQGGVCRVLIAHETLIHIQNQFQVEHWGLSTLKGKQQLVDVYRVLSSLTPESPILDKPEDKPEP